MSPNFCPDCGRRLEGEKFCPGCGLATPRRQPRAARTSAPRPRDERRDPTPARGSLQGSLARLGIGLARRKLLGFLVAVVTGWIVSGILPWVYPVLVGYLQGFLNLDTPTRDAFNMFTMTALTALASFLVSFVIFRAADR